MLDDDEPDPWAKWRHMLRARRGIDLAELQATRRRCTCCRAPAPGEFFDEQVQRPTGASTAARRRSPRRIERCHALFAETVGASARRGCA